MREGIFTRSVARLVQVKSPDYGVDQGLTAAQAKRLLAHARDDRITLEAYVHWLPKKDRARGVVGNALRKADESQHEGKARAQDRF